MHPHHRAQACRGYRHVGQHGLQYEVLVLVRQTKCARLRPNGAKSPVIRIKKQENSTTEAAKAAGHTSLQANPTKITVFPEVFNTPKGALR